MKLVNEVDAELSARNPATELESTWWRQSVVQRGKSDARTRALDANGHHPSLEGPVQTELPDKEESAEPQTQEQ